MHLYFYCILQKIRPEHQTIKKVLCKNIQKLQKCTRSFERTFFLYGPQKTLTCSLNEGARLKEKIRKEKEQDDEYSKGKIEGIS